MDKSSGRDFKESLVGSSVPRWLLTVVLWGLAGVMTFYGSVRFNDGARQALEERLNSQSARIAALEQRSISKPEHEDLIKRMDTFEENQREMNHKIDELILRLARRP